MTKEQNQLSIYLSPWRCVARPTLFTGPASLFGFPKNLRKDKCLPPVLRKNIAILQAFK